MLLLQRIFFALQSNQMVVMSVSKILFHFFYILVGIQHDCDRFCNVEFFFDFLLFLIDISPFTFNIHISFDST